MIIDNGDGSGVCSGASFWNGFGYGSGSAPGRGWHSSDRTSEGGCHGHLDFKEFNGDGSGSGDGSSEPQGKGCGGGYGILYSEDEGRHYNRAFVWYDYVYLLREKVERRMYDGQFECYISQAEAEVAFAMQLLGQG